MQLQGRNTLMGANYLALLTALVVVAFSSVALAQSTAFEASGEKVPLIAEQALIEEIELLADEGDVEVAAETARALFSDVSNHVQSGRLTVEEALDIAAQVQNAVSKVDIDVHFGTDEKCDDKFNCVKGTKTCISITWRTEDGGGRNCYNF